jgi:hypothetical protein
LKAAQPSVFAWSHTDTIEALTVAGRYRDNHATVNTPGGLPFGATSSTPSSTQKVMYQWRPSR